MQTHFGTSRREPPSLSMTPMIDVVFLLLIFFVCTANFEPLELLLPGELPAPTRGTAQLPTEAEVAELERIVIAIEGSAGATVLQVNEQPCASLAELRELLAALATIDAALPVTLDASDDVSLGSVIDVYDASRLAGFAQIQFATRLP